MANKHEVVCEKLQGCLLYYFNSLLQFGNTNWKIYRFFSCLELKIFQVGFCGLVWEPNHPWQVEILELYHSHTRN